MRDDALPFSPSLPADSQENWTWGNGSRTASLASSSLVIALRTMGPVPYLGNTVELALMAKAKGASLEGVRTGKLTQCLTGCST